MNQGVGVAPSYLADPERVRYDRRVRIVFRMAVRAPGGLLVTRCMLARNRKPNRKGFDFMYAVIETGGKQYRVMPGQTIQVDTIAGDVGADVEFDRVLAISNEANELVL